MPATCDARLPGQARPTKMLVREQSLVSEERGAAYLHTITGELILGANVVARGTDRWIMRTTTRCVALLR